MKLIYLACPYTHSDKWVRVLRHALITAVGARLIEQGHHIFGPITESHMYQEYGEVPTTWEFWGEHDKMMLNKCDELWVIKMKGWKESVGVQAEIKWAEEHDIPISYFKLEDILPEVSEVL